LTIVPAGVEDAATGVGDDEEAQAKVCTLYDAVRAVHDSFPECPVSPEEDPEGGDPDDDEPAAAAATVHIHGEPGPELVNLPAGTHVYSTDPGCTDCDNQHAAVVDETTPDEDKGTEGEAAIYGWGAPSESEDPETQAAILRVKELLDEGAVGVSIAHDMNPDDMPDPDLLDALAREERWDELDDLLSDVKIRPRHVAIVDTPAFSDARLTMNDDGTWEGALVFEGRWTGDMRRLPYQSLVWDEDLLPIPVIWDRAEGDHTAMTVGYIDRLERQEGVTASMIGPRIVAADVTAVTAAAGVSNLPARLVAKFKADKAMPVKVEAPDANGLRRIWGTAAPKGVCHRSDMGACFQFPGDIDPQHRHFHTGALVTLDNGEEVRMGALTFEGPHIDTGLARKGVTARDVNLHREASNKVLAMVRAWETPHGLDFSGVLAADVTEAQLMQALACAPSVELWPAGRGRTLVGIHLVPTPAWPVAASAGGSAQTMTSTIPVEVDGLGDTPPVDVAAELQWQSLVESVDRIEKALALLLTDKIADGIDLPEEGE
jgi:hypothetical protein